jgi:hypothetical protein
MNEKRKSTMIELVEVVKKLEFEARLPSTPKLTRERLRALAEEVRQGVYDEEADEGDKEEMRKLMPRNVWTEFGL